MARANLSLGYVYLQTKQELQAMPYFEKALKTYEELGNQAMAARAISGLAGCEVSLGRHEDALKDAQLIEEIGRQTNEKT